MVLDGEPVLVGDKQLSVTIAVMAITGINGRWSPHPVHVDGINGSAGLCLLLKCENVLWRVTPSKL